MSSDGRRSQVGDAVYPWKLNLIYEPLPGGSNGFRPQLVAKTTAFPTPNGPAGDDIFERSRRGSNANYWSVIPCTNADRAAMMSKALVNGYYCLEQRGRDSLVIAFPADDRHIEETVSLLELKATCEVFHSVSHGTKSSCNVPQTHRGF